MWQSFFTIYNFLCNFIPNREKRARVRREKLYDWAKKYRALRDACPELKFRHVKMIKGGWNIGFIVDYKYVFKIRKFFATEKNPVDKIMHEKRMTDAFAKIVWKDNTKKEIKFYTSISGKLIEYTIHVSTFRMYSWNLLCTSVINSKRPLRF